jgi:PhoH-like ATPase
MVTRDIFILDTSVLIYNPLAYKDFPNSTVCVPIVVIEELDKLKKLSNETGKNARVAIRNLDDVSNLGEIHVGVKLDNDIILKIDAGNYGSIKVNNEYGDNIILSCAMKIKEGDGWNKITLVSRDINLRVRSKALGLLAADYEKGEINNEEVYRGYRTVEDEEAGAVLKEAGIISIKDYEELNDMHPNEYVSFVGKKSKGISLGRRVGKQIKIVKDITPWDLELRNMEQLCAVDLIMDPSIPLVSLVGKSGGGKTLICMSAALELVLNQKKYSSFMIFRSTHTIGKDLGFLPGSLSEKIEPLFGAIGDAFSLLFPNKGKDGWRKQLFQYIDNGTIEQGPISYLRGRSIPNSFILVDEAQNISPEEIKAILTRCGEKTKIVLTGDTGQIDAPQLDACSNGLSYVIDRFKGSELAGSIYFTKGERSELASLASEIL